MSTAARKRAPGARAISSKRLAQRSRTKRRFSEKQTALYENGFYLTCHPYRMAKALAHYELFKKSLEVPGDIVECGVFLGASLMRFVKFRNIFTNPSSRRVIAFDCFGKFPPADSEADQRTIQTFLDRFGAHSITIAELNGHLAAHHLQEGVELVPGDIRETVPRYVKRVPDQRISLINIDVDFRSATKTVLDCLYDHVSPGGVIILDDYGSFAGANEAIEEFLSAKGQRIRKLPFAATPSYVVKGE